MSARNRAFIIIIVELIGFITTKRKRIIILSIAFRITRHVVIPLIVVVIAVIATTLLILYFKS